MTDFLSDVFEFDVDSMADSIRRDSLHLKLFGVESHSLGFSKNNHQIIFSFKVKTEGELKEIVSKYNFFLYRKSSPDQEIEKIELVEEETKKILNITDIDQRLWRFEYDSALGSTHEY